MARLSGLALAYSTYDAVVVSVCATGYTAITALGLGILASRAAMAVATARLPPALSPAMAMRVGSPLMLAAFFTTHAYAANASSCCAGNLCSGAKR